MTDSPKNPGPDDKQSSVGSVRSAGRRRLLQAGISAAPVIMTVASRPVLAQAGGCVSPSGFASGNLSQTTMVPCAGFTPTHWNNAAASEWSAIGLAKASVRIRDVFTSGSPSSSDNTLLTAVLSEGANTVRREIVAAYLNTLANKIPNSILTASVVNGMWNEFALTGGYTPKTGTTWTGAQLLAYLQTLNNTP